MQNKLKQLKFEKEMIWLELEAKWDNTLADELEKTFKDIPFKSVPFKKLIFPHGVTIEYSYGYSRKVIVGMDMIIPEFRMSNDIARNILQMKPLWEWWVAGKYSFLEKVNELYMEKSSRLLEIDKEILRLRKLIRREKQKQKTE